MTLTYARAGRWFGAVFVLVIMSAPAARAESKGNVPGHWAIRSAKQVGHRLHIVLADGRAIDVPPDDGQCSFDDIQISPDGVTVGWVGGGDVEEPGGPACAPDAQYVAEGPIIWRAGKVIRRFNNDPAGEINWKFYHKGDQIALNAGPVHFDNAQTCNLYDLKTGRLLKSWSHDDNTSPPAWAADIIDY